MEFIEYCFENWKKILVTSILFQVSISIIFLINNFTQQNAERLFMIYFSIVLPNWASIFLIGIPEVLFFILSGFCWFKIEGD